jgi:hypothetical protein
MTCPTVLFPFGLRDAHHTSVRYIQAISLPRVRIEHMLVDHVALLLIKLRRVCARKLVEHGLNCVPHRRPCCLTLLPVEHELFTFELRQQVWQPSSLRALQQVEDGQLLICKLLGEAALLLREFIAESQQWPWLVAQTRCR